MRLSFADARRYTELADLHEEGIKRLRNMWLDERTLFYGDEIPAEMLSDHKTTNVAFLGGPTSRDGIPEYLWRKDGHHHLRSDGYTGYILIPEYRGDSYLSDEKFDFKDKQKIVRWEGRGLKAANIRIFWIPRNKEQLRAQVTNHEIAKWLGKAEHDPKINKSLFIGWPDHAIGMSWLATEMEDGKVGKLEGGHYSGLQTLCKGVTDIYRDMDDDIPF